MTVRHFEFDLGAYAEELARRRDEAVMDAILGRPPRHASVELITDPGDLRGFNAKPVGRAA